MLIKIERGPAKTFNLFKRVDLCFKWSIAHQVERVLELFFVSSLEGGQKSTNVATRWMRFGRQNVDDSKHERIISFETKGCYLCYQQVERHNKWQMVEYMVVSCLFDRTCQSQSCSQQQRWDKNGWITVDHQSLVERPTHRRKHDRRRQHMLF